LIKIFSNGYGTSLIRLKLEISLKTLPQASLVVITVVYSKERKISTSQCRD